jgi:hypothetical protein
MEILKEITQWDVGYRQPNHTYLINDSGKVVAFAKWHSSEIVVLKSRKPLDKRYRKFQKVDHKDLANLFSNFKNEQDEKEEKQEPVKKDNIRLFKVTSKDREYLVEYNVLGKFLTCPCIGYGYRRKCKHVDAVAKKLGV